jgi:DNA polymerase-3 subunit epsilon
MNFTAIDFETATGKRNSACAVGMVVVKNGYVQDEYYSLIQPPENMYWWRNTQVHGIRPADTLHSPTFFDIFPEIQKRLSGTIPVAHNESFDRSVLRHTMVYYGLDYDMLKLPLRWECTMKIYRAAGFRPYKLNACCERMGVSLNHHEALSDARACAQLYLKRMMVV